jgi:hypothetical protein
LALENSPEAAHAPVPVHYIRVVDISATHALGVVTIVLLLEITRRILGIGSANAGADDRT